MLMRSQKRGGFTLIELIIVIAIIAVLAGLLIPLIVSGVEAARLSRTASEMRSIMSAMQRYFADVGEWAWSVQTAGYGWGGDVGLVNRGRARGTHQSRWRGPYMEDWPIRTAWGTLASSVGYEGIYYMHTYIGWIDNAQDGANDRWLHTNTNVYTAAQCTELDRLLDDGNRDTGRVRYEFYIYHGEGPGS